MFIKKIKFICIAILISSASYAYGQNRTIMITAATGSFGQEISNALAKEGYNIIIAGRNQSKLDALQKRLEAKYKKITIQSVIIDFSNIETIKKATKHLYKQKLHGIVLIGPRPSLSKDIPTSDEWSKAFLENFITPLEVIRLFSPYIQNNGSIIAISGISSKNYLPDYPNTNVIRLAWSGEIKNLAHYFGSRKIRVNAISPGVIMTSHHKNKVQQTAIKNNTTFEDQLAKDTHNIPLKAYGNTEDITNLISFLLSPQSSYITGSNIVIDGGASNGY